MSLPSQTASLELLPPETLLPIVTSLPGLDTLWNLLRASPHIWRLFNDHALFITEGILSGPNSILPHGIAEAVRAVILARSKALPFRNLREFQVQFLRSVFPVFKKSNEKEKYITLGPELLSAAAPPVVVLRSVIATAHQITALSQACLMSYLERVRDPSFRPLHPVDPNIRYTHGYGPEDRRVPAWDRVFDGAPVKVVDAGQPSWVEEMRVVRALWVIQLVGEVYRQTDALGWSTEDVKTLSQMSPAVLVDRLDGYLAMRKSEEVRSLMHYLATLGEATQDTYYRLPRPPPSARWITASPNRNEEFLRLLRYNPDGTPFMLPAQTDDYKWGQTEKALAREALGMKIFRYLTRQDSFLASPISGVKFDSFRRLGFAFWDEWRMHLLGMASGIKNRAAAHDAFYFFAWESILPPDEVEGLKSELREKGRIEEQRHNELSQ
ncbi:hypothetical protein NM208_g4840 [Fusarium decemcellulare]|uniref:Uncharacterized protein n=1 Tax=Fusarium decemcellulare TaxID=57161 RepID=A0ACC1SJ30_9HYPO|nr:hypothetical protein NM208_g4840 [Fusarium decemcellulare]